MSLRHVFHSRLDEARCISPVVRNKIPGLIHGSFLYFIRNLLLAFVLHNLENGASLHI